MTEYGKRNKLTTPDSLKSVEQKVKETREKRKKVLAEVEKRRRRNWLRFLQKRQAHAKEQ